MKKRIKEVKSKRKWTEHEDAIIISNVAINGALRPAFEDSAFVLGIPSNEIKSHYFSALKGKKPTSKIDVRVEKPRRKITGSIHIVTNKGVEILPKGEYVIDTISVERAQPKEEMEEILNKVKGNL